MKKLAFASVIMLGLLCGFWSSTSTADPTVTALGIYGCRLQSLGGTTDGRYQFATCAQTPKGIYYTDNFGSTWTFAAGGAYSGGAAGGLQVTDTTVYVEQNGKLLMTTLPASGAAFVPAWSEVWPGHYVSSFAVRGTLLYSTTDATLTVVSLGGGDPLQTIILADTALIRISVTGSRLYAVALPANGLSGRLMAYDIGLGGLLTAAGDLTPAGFYVMAVTTETSGNVYAYLNDLVADGGVYLSTNQGGSFNRIGDRFQSLYGGCFSGASKIAGTVYSTDNGATWNPISGTFTAGRPYLGAGNCVIDPLNPNRAMIGTMRGVAVTSGLSDSTTVWNDALSGLEGVTVYEVAQRNALKDYVVAATSSGVLATASFTSAAPTWNWTCPGNTEYTVCSAYTTVAASPSENGVFYASTQETGKLYRGVMSPAGVISWSEFAASHPAGVMYAIRTFDVLPNTLLAAPSTGAGTHAWTGALVFYSLADGSITKTALSGVSLAGVEALSSDVIFAWTRAADLVPTTVPAGLYRSTNGGDSFEYVSDPLFGENPSIVGASYDSTRDVLWVAISRATDWLLYLENAAHGGSAWRASPSLPSVGAQTLLAVPSIGKVYTAGYGQLFVTADQGASWRNLMNHSWEEQIYSLFYDELVVCSQLGLQGVTDDQVAPSCSLKTPGYRGKKVVLPKKFTFKVQYSGSQQTGQLQTKRNSNAAWRKLGNLKFKNTRATLKKVISRSQQVRASMADCVTESVTIKGKKR